MRSDARHAATRQSRDLAWIRGDVPTFAGSHGFVVVRSHAPAPSVELHSSRINIGAGVHLTNRLTAPRIDADGPIVLGGAAR